MMKTNEKQREYRKKTGNAATKKYEKTPRGFLMRMYRNMESRIKGIQKVKAHLYKGKELVERNEFYWWAWNHKDFWKLFSKYQDSYFKQKFAPTVDRKNPQKGYLISNMEWVTHSENSRRGSINRHNEDIVRTTMKVVESSRNDLT